MPKRKTPSPDAKYWSSWLENSKTESILLYVWRKEKEDEDNLFLDVSYFRRYGAFRNNTRSFVAR